MYFDPKDDNDADYRSDIAINRNGARGGVLLLDVTTTPPLLPEVLQLVASDEYMSTIAITSIKWFIMRKSIKVFVDKILHHDDFFGMSVYHLTTRIIWEYSFKTSSTISVVSR